MLSLAKFIKKYAYTSLIVSREIELRENLVGTGFINPPDEKSDFNNRVTITGKSLVRILMFYRRNSFYSRL